MNVTNDARRLPVGGRVDRNRPLEFRFDGRRYVGFDGDTLASALLANGVVQVGRSFKYHRPRGILAAGIEEPNAIVQLLGPADEPNLPATCVELAAGLEARSVNCWPSLRWDVGALNDRLHGLFPAGFYYKTFMWPANGWNFYGNLIRRAAGLGRAPRRYAVDERYEKCYHHCDVLIVGAGPAGLAAALVAGRARARVLLVDEQTEPGGQLLSRDGALGEASLRWVRDAVDELASLPDVIHLQRAAAVGYYDHNMVYVHERSAPGGPGTERLWRVRARRVILATGALERPLVFADNDRPGVMLASAAATYVQRYAVRPGLDAVVVTNNDTAYDSALALARSGVRVAALVDVRPDPPRERVNTLRVHGIEPLVGHTVVGVRGRHATDGIVVARIDAPRARRSLSCDLVAISGGWNPTVHLHAQSGAKPRYDPRLVSFVPGASVQHEACAGAAAGTVGIADAIRQGSALALQAVGDLGFAAQRLESTPDIAPWSYSIAPAWELPGGRRGARAFVDYGHDVTADDVRLALRENYTSVEHVKRYTTAGMAIDQGKLGNVNTIGLIAATRGVAPDAVGTTTFRPLYRPVRFGAWAGHDRGELITPARRTPITSWFEQAGAIFNEGGEAFRRPFQIPRRGESAHEAVCREALAVRNAVGIYDGTPLGKFELNGPDVVSLLNRVYTNRWDTLPIGMGRFGWMLFEDGRLFDDGVTFRLGPQHYLMSTGSSVASAVHMHLERLLQCEWTDLAVFVTPVTEQWANVCLCGPRAREVLAAAGTDLDLEPRAFPFMAMRSGRVAGFDARVARVSYTGELSFEINVPARNGRALWDALIAAGGAHGITPVGSETSLLLRLEKGYVAAWAEGDGYVTPPDAGLEWNVDMTKHDFIGKRALVRDRRVGGARPQIVGLLPEDPNFVPSDGAPLVDPAARDATEFMIGHVTAAGYSPNLGRSIALAQLVRGRERLGERVTISTIGRRDIATVTKPVFVDPENRRMRS